MYVLSPATLHLIDKIEVNELKLKGKHEPGNSLPNFGPGRNSSTAIQLAYMRRLLGGQAT